MSKKIDAIDLDKLRASWIRAYQPVGSAQRSGWEDDWRTELRDLCYLKLTHFSANGTLRQLVEIRGEINLARRNLDFVKMDLERVWARVSIGTQAFHSILTYKDTLIVSFGALNEHDAYVSGAVTLQTVN